MIPLLPYEVRGFWLAARTPPLPCSVFPTPSSCSSSPSSPSMLPALSIPPPLAGLPPACTLLRARPPPFPAPWPPQPPRTTPRPRRGGIAMESPSRHSAGVPHWWDQWPFPSQRVHLFEALAPTAPGSIGPGMVALARPAPGIAGAAGRAPAIPLVVSVVAPEVVRIHTSSATIISCWRVTTSPCILAPAMTELHV